MAKQEIHIDARMINHSGIGVYLRSVLPFLAPLSEHFNVKLIGPKPLLQQFIDQYPLPFKIVNLGAEPYSVRTTLLPFGSFRNIENLWVPHYNIPWCKTKNLVVTVHDILHLRTDIIPRSQIQALYAKITFAILKRNASKVIFVSNFTRNEFVTHVGAPKAWSVIHNGVSNNWRVLRNKPVQAPDLPPYLFFIGNQLKHKNLTRLLDAYSMLEPGYPYDLVIAGKMSGLRTPDIHPLLRGELSNKKVHILGVVPPETLEQLMKHAKALVFPSLYEGFGFPPVEALACGTSVFASDIPVHREILGSRVQYFDPTSVADIAKSLQSIPINRNQCFSSTDLPYNWEFAGKQLLAELIDSFLKTSVCTFR